MKEHQSQAATAVHHLHSVTVVQAVQAVQEATVELDV
jgi:hypothetical protein